MKRPIASLALALACGSCGRTSPLQGVGENDRATDASASATKAPTSGSNSAQDEARLQYPAPHSLQASSSAPDAVTLTFSAPLWVENAAERSGYLVARDGVALATLPPDATNYVDITATPAKLEAPAELSAAARSDGSVLLTWSPSAGGAAGDAHTYTVTALYGERSSRASEPAAGRRAWSAPDRYQISRDGGATWLEPTTERSYVDHDALALELANAETFAEALLVPRGAIRLRVEGAPYDGGTVTYVVRSENAYGVSPPSIPARSTVPFQKLSFQWQRASKNEASA